MKVGQALSIDNTFAALSAAHGAAVKPQPCAAAIRLRRHRAQLMTAGMTDDRRGATKGAVNPRSSFGNDLAEPAIREALAGGYGEIDRRHRVLARYCDKQPFAARHRAVNGLS